MVALKMGMFGRGANPWDTPPIHGDAVPEAPFGRVGGQITAEPPKAGFFDASGMGVRLLGGISDGILGANGMAPVFGPSQDRRVALQQQQQQYQQKRQDEQSDWMARQQWEISHPKPENNDTAMDAALYDSRLGAGSGDQYLRNQLDPIVNIPLPGGRVYVGPRSGIGALTGGVGAGAKPPVASSPTPGTVEGGYRFKGGNAGDPTAWEPVGGAGPQAPRPFR